MLALTKRLGMIWHLVPRGECFQNTQLASWEHLVRLAGR